MNALSVHLMRSCIVHKARGQTSSVETLMQIRWSQNTLCPSQGKKVSQNSGDPIFPVSHSIILHPLFPPVKIYSLEDLHTNRDFTLTQKRHGDKMMLQYLPSAPRRKRFHWIDDRHVWVILSSTNHCLIIWNYGLYHWWTLSSTLSSHIVHLTLLVHYTSNAPFQCTIKPHGVHYTFRINLLLYTHRTFSS